MVGVIAVGRSQKGGCSSPDQSVATHWTEAVLDAIRRDFPAPTVHSRNLYHLSAAMWDTWAAYEPTATGVFVDEMRVADDIERDRNEAISFAAHHLLTSRYRNSTGATASLAQFDETLSLLCSNEDAADDPASAAAFGVRVAESILAASIDDGSLEANGYRDSTYESANPPLVVDQSGTEMNDPKPLAAPIDCFPDNPERTDRRLATPRVHRPQLGVRHPVCDRT